ncbi:MAG: CDP-diacylglycerol--serine O-phosphatidyltransferase [Candidatus Egerieousia sp.]
MNIIRHIPNTITCCNLLCGCMAIVSAVNGQFEYVLLCIIGAAVFDFFDGMSARLLKAYSPIGKELDSLADMVSFGVAPAIAGFTFMMDLTDYKWMAIFPLLIAPLSALRLAKFNLDERQSENFIGLATPACALMVASLLACAEHYPVLFSFLSLNVYVLPLFCVILALLLTSEIPMFSMKFKSLNHKENRERFLFLDFVLGSVIATAIVGGRYSMMIFFAFAIYLIMNLFLALRKKLVKKS